MRYAVAIIVLLVASIVVPLYATPPCAILTPTSQNLDWKLNVGTRLNYTYAAFDTEGLVIQLYYILEIENLTEIPDPLTNVSILLVPNYILLYENGTEIQGTHPDISWYMLPVGNWSLLANYFERVFSANVTIIDDGDSFGLVAFGFSGQYLKRIEFHCSEEDGALLLSNVQLYQNGQIMFTAVFERGWSNITTTTSTTTSTVTTTSTTTTTSTGSSSSTGGETSPTQTSSTTTSQPSSDTLILAFTSGGIIVLIVIVVLMKRK